MKATELLREQHREIERLFQRLQAAEDEDKASVFRELAAMIAGHTAIETEIFYPAAMQAQIMTEDVREAKEEHAAIDFTLYKLFQVNPHDATFQARAAVLDEIFTRHVEDREEALLSQVDMSMGDRRLEELGDELEARMQAVQRKGQVRAMLAQRLGMAVAKRPVRRAQPAVKPKPARAAAKAKKAPARPAGGKRAARPAPSRPSKGRAAPGKATRSRKASRSSR